MLDTAVGIDAGVDGAAGVCFPPNIFFQKDCLGVEDAGAFVAADVIGMDGRCIAEIVGAVVRALGIFRSPGGRMGVTRGAEDIAEDDGAVEDAGSGVGALGLAADCGMDVTGGARAAGVGHAFVRGAMDGTAGVVLVVRGRAAACAAVGDGFGRLASPR